MARLSDVALALQLHAELRSDQPEVTVVRRKTSHSRWRSNTAEEWRRGKCLGEGGYGQVYLEECISGGTIGSVRAVKKLQKARSEDYHHELNALALFSLGKYSDSFVQCFGWYATEQHIYFAMEYMPYGDLQQYIHQPLTEAEAQLIIGQVLEALVYMHERDFTHRDLKPGNILVSNPGPNWWIKVADFGISKRTQEDITALRTSKGTQNFAAPEIRLSSTSTYTNAVDVWGVGMIMLLILAGTKHIDFTGILRYSVDLEKCELDMTYITQSISQDCRSFLRALLQRDAKDRPSADESLQHGWLTTATSPSDAPALESQTMATGHTAESLLPTANWSLYGEEIDQTPTSVAHRSAIPPLLETLSMSEPQAQSMYQGSTLRQTMPYQDRWAVIKANARTRSDAGSKDTVRDLRSPKSTHTLENSQLNLSNRSSDRSKSLILPDTPVAVMVSIDKRVGKVEMAMAALAPGVFASKLRQALGMQPDWPCEIQWLDDTVGDFEYLDESRPESFGTMLHHARSNRVVRIKVTRASPDYDTSAPYHSRSNEARPEVKVPAGTETLKSTQRNPSTDKDSLRSSGKNFELPPPVRAKQYGNRPSDNHIPARPLHPPLRVSPTANHSVPQAPTTQDSHGLRKLPVRRAKPRDNQSMQGEKEAQRKQAEIDKETDRLYKMYGRPPQEPSSSYSQPRPKPQQLPQSNESRDKANIARSPESLTHQVDDNIQINVITSNESDMLELNLKRYNTIRTALDRLQSQHGIDCQDLDLIWNDIKLDGGRTFSWYKIPNNAVIKFGLIG